MQTSTFNAPVPIVRFEYPNRVTASLEPRLVRVVELTDTHVRGYEIPWIDADDSYGKFKVFRRDKIPARGLELVSYQP